MADYIEMHGHEVTIASNGKEAVELFRARDLDLAFMDVRMQWRGCFFEIQKLRPGEAAGGSSEVPVEVLGGSGGDNSSALPSGAS